MNTRRLFRAGMVARNPALADDNEVIMVEVPAINDRDDNGR